MQKINKDCNIYLNIIYILIKEASHHENKIITCLFTAFFSSKLF
jgi:hypothetical protein